MKTVRGLHVILGFTLLGSGCTVLSDAFTAHTETVARVGDRELSVARLAELFVLGQPIPLEREVAYELTHHWVNFIAFADRMAAGDSLLDSNLVREAMWLEVKQSVIAALKDRLRPGGYQLSDAAVDSSYRVGEMRMLAHVLRRVGPETSPDEKERQRLTAERIRQQLIDGASWESANEQSEDEIARFSNGSLGLVKRAQTVPRFENAAFALLGGELSEVVETRFGFHIIYRPQLDDVRDEFADLVRQQLSSREDSAYAAQLLEARNVVVRSGAAAIIREVVGNPWRLLQSEKVLSRYQGRGRGGGRGGRFTAGQFASWIPYLPQGALEQLIGADDDDVADFIRQLVLQELLADQADSAGLRLSDSAYSVIEAQYRGGVETMWRTIGVEPDSLAAQATTLSDRQRIAARRVDDYFDAIASRALLLQPVPPSLAAQLRASVEWSIVPAGIERAMEVAGRLRAATEEFTPSTTGDAEPESR